MKRKADKGSTTECAQECAQECPGANTHFTCDCMEECLEMLHSLRAQVQELHSLMTEIQNLKDDFISLRHRSILGGLARFMIDKITDDYHDCPLSVYSAAPFSLEKTEFDELCELKKFYGSPDHYLKGIPFEWIEEAVSPVASLAIKKAFQFYKTQQKLN